MTSTVSLLTKMMVETLKADRILKIRMNLTLTLETMADLLSQLQFKTKLKVIRYLVLTTITRRSKI
jgi:hypothetical protein